MNTALNEEINSYISYGEDNNSDDESNLPERCDISGETVLNVAFNAVAARIDSTDTDSESATVPSEDKFWQCQENSGISDSKDNYVGNHDGQFAIDNRIQRPPLEKSLSEESSLIDGLLCEIYDRWHGGSFRADSFDSDTFTECSSTSEALHIPGYTGRGFPSDAPWQKVRSRQVHREFLRSKGIPQLKSMLADLRQSNAQMSIRIIRQLKRRDRRLAKLQKNYDIVTAILQASSLKRRIDTRMRFSIDPQFGLNAFDQWKDAMKAVARLPHGIPDEFRKKAWLNLADNHLRELKVDWEKTVRFAFNEKSNPDDNKLGLQIVKDLHRTGCSGFSGHDNEEDRAVLKRVLLAYARWNKNVGYCQGFNIIAALLLDVMDRKEDDALKVMIYLIDHVLPESYFANNLRALSVDMAVFRDMLHTKFPKLSKHLDMLQHKSASKSTGTNYEPPLTNVFTMQWFLTLFATCLPKHITLRVWDCILLEGSEILLRAALVIWSKLSGHILAVDSADEFYTVMGFLCQDMMDGKTFGPDDVIKNMYSLGPVPYPQLTDLREKYTYNITPFTVNSQKSSRNLARGMLSDEDELDDEDIEAITCFTGIFNTQGLPRIKGIESEHTVTSAASTSSGSDISSLGAGAFGEGAECTPRIPCDMERMTTDISALKKQYQKLSQRQRQAHVIISAVSSRKSSAQPPTRLVPKIETPMALNHLFISKQMAMRRNRCITDGPMIAPLNAKPCKQNSGHVQRKIASPVRSVSSCATGSAFPKSFSMPQGMSMQSLPLQDSQISSTVDDSVYPRNRTGSIISVTSEYSATSNISESSGDRDNHTMSPSFMMNDRSSIAVCDRPEDSAIMVECDVDSEEFDMDDDIPIVLNLASTSDHPVRYNSHGVQTDSFEESDISEYKSDLKPNTDDDPEEHSAGAEDADGNDKLHHPIADNNHSNIEHCDSQSLPKVPEAPQSGINVPGSPQSLPNCPVFHKSLPQVAVFSQSDTEVPVSPLCDIEVPVSPHYLAEVHASSQSDHEVSVTPTALPEIPVSPQSVPTVPLSPSHSHSNTDEAPAAVIEQTSLNISHNTPVNSNSARYKYSPPHHSSSYNSLNTPTNQSSLKMDVESASKHAARRSNSGSKELQSGSAEETAMYLYKVHKETHNRRSRTQHRSTSGSMASKHGIQMPASPTKSPPRPYNPFPVRQLNMQRATQGVKLGLYTPEMVEEVGNKYLGNRKLLTCAPVKNSRSSLR